MDKDQEHKAEMRKKTSRAESAKPAKASGGGFKAWGTAEKVISEHTVGGGDTLGHIALKYYGHATKPYWMVIYEANKAEIGDDPNKLKRGITLKIPELPTDLKD